jgi:hypothetical protein
MKKIYFLIVFFGALLFCACDKDNSDLLIENQVQTQVEEGTLKGAQAHGKKHAVPFRGEFEQEQTFFTFGPPVYAELEGVGTVTHLGNTKLWVGQIWDDSNYPSLEGPGEIIFTAANGDELYADLYVHCLLEVDENWNPVFGTYWGTGEFLGGTGRFSDASGTYDFSADFDFITGESNSLYKGEIMY